MDLDELRGRIVSGDVVVVVGAGVSILASGNHACAGWTGLLESGIQHCVNHAGVGDAWATRARADLSSGDLDDLLSAAEKVERKLRAGGEYARWLADTVGSLPLRDPAVLVALAELGCPILTTNYDDLLEKAVPSLPTVTWRQNERLELALRDPSKRAVVHLHGHWADLESVVLGIRSYEKILGHEHTQAILRGLRSAHTLLYVGCGAGLSDPNFHAFRQWAREVLGGSPFRHFRLAREADLAAVQQEHPSEDRINVLSYGRDYPDLVGFLSALRPPTATPYTVRTPMASASPRRPRNLPYDSLGALFKGREGVLAELHARLRAPSTQAAAIVAKQAIHGLGGVGKTRLAVEYALRYQDEYCALLFVPAETPAALNSNLAALCDALVLNLPEREVQDEQVRVGAALRWLGEHSGWLLVLDNVDTPPAQAEVGRLLGQLQGGHVLVTSRLSHWGAGVDTLELDVLGEDDAVAFLLERTRGRRRAGPADDVDARVLARELGWLALALEQAGAFIARLHESLGGYLRRWRERETKVRAWHDEALMHYPHSVAVTWDTSVSQLEAGALALLRLLCWLAPEPIPRAVLETEAARQALGEGVERLVTSGERARAEADIEEALAALEGFSLVKWEGGDGGLRLHRLVQEVTRERLAANERKAWLGAMLAVTDAYLPNDPPPWDVRAWPRWEPMRVHVAGVVAAAAEAGIPHPTSRLMDMLGGLLKVNGVWAEAEALRRRALAIAEASFGPDHPEVASYLNNLAQLLQATNRLGEAEPLMRRALAIDEASYGPDHPEVATDLNNLAQLLQATNRLGEAEPLMRRVVQIFEKSLGADHPNVASALNNLAQLLQATNRLGEAEPLMRRALAIDEAGYGPDHPDVARDLNNLAALLQATNRLGEAEPLMRRALAIDEASYGPDHPEVATDLNNLAQLLQATNRLGEAEPLMRRVVQIFEKSLGADHPNVASALNNLAALLQATNRLGEAEPLMRRALAIDEASYGPDHPDVARDLNNLALLLQATNRLGEAEPLMRRVVQIFEKSLGADHPNVASALNNLAALLKATNRLGEAEPLMRRALAIDEASYGPDHPEVATDLNNLAQLLQATNRLGEAEPLMRRAVEIFVAFTQATGHEHPGLRTVVANYTRLLRQMGRSQDEAQAEVQALAARFGVKLGAT